ncbi:MAG: HD domain-containing protein [Phycisphaerales bacterium]|nr:HD domain-containing protein [Phycisphaerales bacterium]
MKEKLIRDPVHDVIVLRLDDPGEALLFNLINAREFQRLRRIRQLGLACLTYPGAEHTRYSHSLGVMQTARRILNRLSRQVRIDPYQRIACLAAALLHDLGHGPFSHVFERISGVHHESFTRRIILDQQSEVHQLLQTFDPDLPQLVQSLLQRDHQSSWMHDLLNSQLDADRFDYLLRDNLMSGSRYGHFDLRWLVQHLVIDPSTNRLAVTHKGISAVETYLQARYHMYRNVYFHKVVRSAEGMVQLTLQRARLLAVQERLAWPRREEPVYKALLGQQLTIDEFIDLDDIAIMHCFKLWADSDDAILADLCHGLLYRHLFKSHDLTHLEDQAQATELRQAAAEAILVAGGDPTYAMFYDEPADTPYTPYPDRNDNDAQPIFILLPNGQQSDFDSLSPLGRVLEKQLMFRRIHFSAEYRELITSIF